LALHKQAKMKKPAQLGKKSAQNRNFNKAEVEQQN